MNAIKSFEEIQCEMHNCYKYLHEIGWTDMIDCRWTLEIQKILMKQFPSYGDSIDRVLKVVIWPMPDFNVENNEILPE